MTINAYKWNDIPDDIREKLMRRGQANIDEALKTVQPIINDVKTRGDSALIDYTKKFDSADLTSIKVMPEEFERADRTIDQDLKSAIGHCVRNVRTFHEEQLRRVETSWMVEIEPGVMAGENVTPIESVGLYVPRGKGAFPSAMYMLCIPAVIAGVPDIVVTTPPRADGRADDASLYTARLCGVENVYKIGGAQAIAALAYGTETIPQVKKVLGPGSPYVAAAKKLCSDIMDPGMPAGPSESIILADETADPHNTCLDILNEAEHGPDSAALLLTHHTPLLDYVKSNLGKMIDDLPQPHRDICKTVFGPNGYGALILTENIDQSVEIANAYAAEHLHIKLSDENLEDCGLTLYKSTHDSNLHSKSTGEEKIRSRSAVPDEKSHLSDSSPKSNSPHTRSLHSTNILSPLPENGLCKIQHAGEILIGEHTPSSLGNYGIGVNHVLPTGGWAHTYSCTSIWDFLKRTSISYCTDDGFNALKSSVETLTEYENFPAHTKALTKRKT